MNIKKMNKGLDFLRGKYGAKKGSITIKGGHCYVGTTPLLPGRMERKIVELKKMTENGTLEGVSTLRFASFAPKGADMAAMLAKELDLAAYLGAADVVRVMAVAGGSAVNVLAKLANDVNVSVEVGAALPRGEVGYDPKSRVNTFAHVNHQADKTRLGVLLCINGTGILNAWVHRNITPDISYADMNDLAATVPIGSEGVTVIPFGNGAERVLENKEVGCSINGLNFNKHNKAHVVRAAQEGIVFSFCYGMEIMQQMGMELNKIHAGKANMFLSPLFRDTLAGVSGATIELYETDGSVGAAKGAGMGCGLYKDNNEAFATLKKLAVIEPDEKNREAYRCAYTAWKEQLSKM